MMPEQRLESNLDHVHDPAHLVAAVIEAQNTIFDPGGEAYVIRESPRKALVKEVRHRWAARAELPVDVFPYREDHVIYVWVECRKASGTRLQEIKKWAGL